MTSDPSHYVQPEASEPRINRLWSNISERLERRPARAWRWLALAGGLAAAAGGVWLVQGAGPRSGLSEQAQRGEAASLRSAAEPLALTLLDGSKLSLAARSEISLQRNQPAAVALSLARGRVELDVVPRAERSFKVRAGDVEVRVVGTQFSVQATPEAGGLRVEVSVRQGVVEVESARRPGLVARVVAGQTWLQRPGADPVDEALPSAASPSAAVEVPRKPEPVSAVAPSASAVLGPSARDLFEKAGASRRAGDAPAAARAYEELLRLHPGDARASLAAFELGRLRMDRLGDSAGAIVALERAVALNVGPSFREDALARLVSVYAAQGNFAACGRARDRYLASYPAGVHAAAVKTRCGSR